MFSKSTCGFFQMYYEATITASIVEVLIRFSNGERTKNISVFSKMVDTNKMGLYEALGLASHLIL